MIEVESNDIEVNSIQLSSNDIDVLGETGSQGNVSPSSPHNKCGNGHGVVKMAKGETAKMH